MDCSLPGFSVYGDSPGKNNGVGCHALLQGTYWTQGSNPGLSPTLQADSLHLEPPEKPTLAYSTVKIPFPFKCEYHCKIVSHPEGWGAEKKKKKDCQPPCWLPRQSHSLPMRGKICFPYHCDKNVLPRSAVLSDLCLFKNPSHEYFWSPFAKLHLNCLLKTEKSRLKIWSCVDKEA